MELCKRSSRLFLSCVTVVATLTLAAPPNVAEDSWWPFSSSSATSKSPSTTSRAAYESLPNRKPADSKSTASSWNPFAKKPTSTRRKNEPSYLTKFWESMTPWEERPVHRPKQIVVSRMRKPAPKKANEKSWFDSLFGSDSPNKPQDVNGFLDQERPKF